MNSKNSYHRTELIYKEKINNIRKSKVAVFGLGGVGSMAAESISRNFLDTLVLIDFDTYEITNLNRQLYSNYDNIGRKKTEVFKENIQKHCPETKIITFDRKVEKENIESFFKVKYDFVVDAVDDVKAKLALIAYCKKNDIDIISCMGTGNRTNPELLTVDDVFRTYNCPLAKKMRKELRKLDITRLDVVYSKEEPVKTEKGKLGSTSFVPGTAGLLMASYVLNRLALKD